jgi:hypothetical protein
LINTRSYREAGMFGRSHGSTAPVQNKDLVR